MKLGELEKAERRWKHRQLFGTRRRRRSASWLLAILATATLAMLLKPGLVAALTEFLP